ncbi:MAG: lytic transglycosylase domain-containing protein [candidate division Zixibacteria bacterium]|nr:lytic transglycosylase domain-containing protein [candidate division Zixibacteria bacterium]
MAFGVKIIRKAGIMVSKPISFLLILFYIAQTCFTVYLALDRFEKEKVLRQQEIRIKELEEKLKILNIIEDFQVGFNEEEVGELTQVIYNESKKYGYDPLLILALILVESSFRKEQVSNFGAQGLMQVKPSIGYDLAKRRGLNWKGELSLFEPAFNIQLGTLYLFELILKFKDVKKALVAYNVGEDALKLRLRSGQKLPAYFLSKVLKTYKELKEKYEQPKS